MRRAFAGILPVEVLNRTRKAFAARRPALGIQSIVPKIRELFTAPIGNGFGYVNSELFLKTVDDLVNGKNNLIIPTERTVTLEMWRRNIADRGMLKGTYVPLETTGKVLEGVA